MDFYHDKIEGCWFGKCLAGAIGMPYEGVPYTVKLTEDEIKISNVPNDDLELQLVWMDALKKYGVELDSKKLAESWQLKIKHGCDEYSTALHNMAHNIMPPASGWKNNFFADGMGAAIRSEIWALLFYDRIDAAGYFAQQDAEVDHWGDGVRGEIFMAMAEAYACQFSDVEAALRFAHEAMEHDCRLYRTLNKVFAMYDAGMNDCDAEKELLITEQRNSNFTDCVMNLAFIVHALLRGQGDFVKTILMTVAFGRDTDCTAASCGAFLGIAKGMKAFPKKWLSLVDDKLILSDFVACIPGVPLTLTDLVKQTIELHEKLNKDLPKALYPAYEPYVPEANLPEIDHAKWLVLDGSKYDVEAIKKQLLATGKCPEELRSEVVEFDTLFMDVSKYAHDANRVHLFSFLTVNNHEVPPEQMVISATADEGMRLWMDNLRLMNHHSKMRMIPSFHRAEGGSAFSLPLAHGSRHLFHVELFYCLPPLRCCIMFGNNFNDHLDGFDFDI